MKKEKLTAYDNFVINKSKFDLFADNSEEKCNSDIKVSELTDNYLINAEPSKDEMMLFSENSKDDGLNVQTDNIAMGEAKSDVKTYDNVHFKKFGKIFLCIYVIIMLALALIVLVKTTIIDNVTNADAAPPIQDNEENYIEVMDDEESKENDNWFDNLCDSLK